jgi:hypothetical protein
MHFTEIGKLANPTRKHREVEELVSNLGEAIHEEDIFRVLSHTASMKAIFEENSACQKPEIERKAQQAFVREIVVDANENLELSILGTGVSYEASDKIRKAMTLQKTKGIRKRNR